MPKRARSSAATASQSADAEPAKRAKQEMLLDTAVRMKPPKKAKPVRRARFFWVEEQGRILLATRASKGMLGGMRALPDDGWAAGNDGDARPPIAGEWRGHENVVQHSFTHFSLEVDLAVYQDGKIVTDMDHDLWWPLDGIADAGLPTLYAKAVKWKLKEET